MSHVHEVMQGECLTRIAADHGFADWRTIYELPQNAELRQNRPDPNVLYPGDQIVIPDREEKWESGGTEERHRFEKNSPKRLLRIAVEDIDGERLTNTPYELEVDKQKRKGATDGDGMLEEQILLKAEEGTLKVGKFVWRLQIGHLNPLKDAPDQGVSGAQARLSNLGYDPGPINGMPNPQTSEALKQFQAMMELPVTGNLDQATRAKLLDKHGC